MICDKEPFPSYKEGIVKIISLSKRKNKKHKFKLYKCDFCGFFHITTINRPLKDGHQKHEKYPFKIGKKQDKLPDVNPNNKSNLLQWNPTPQWFQARQPLLTPLQAEILKHKVNYYSK